MWIKTYLFFSPLFCFFSLHYLQKKKNESTLGILANVTAGNERTVVKVKLWPTSLKSNLGPSLQAAPSELRVKGPEWKERCLNLCLSHSARLYLWQKGKRMVADLPKSRKKKKSGNIFFTPLNKVLWYSLYCDIGLFEFSASNHFKPKNRVLLLKRVPK